MKATGVQQEPPRNERPIHLTERDQAVLLFMAEQYGIRADQLWRLVGKLSQRTTRALLDRWTAGGLINRQKVFAADPPWMWATRKGLAAVPERFPYWEPRPGILDHVYWVNEVRFKVQARHPEATWVSERHLRMESKSRNAAHMPDAVVIRGSKQIAIEVQLQQKSFARAAATMRQLTDRYDGAWVFARPGGPRQVIERGLKELPAERTKRVRVLDLEETM